MSRVTDAIAKHLPKIKAADYGDFLMNATGYPAVGEDETLRQIEELAQKTDGTLEDCCAFAAAELEANWELCKRQEKAAMPNTEFVHE